MVVVGKPDKALQPVSFYANIFIVLSGLHFVILYSKQFFSFNISLHYKQYLIRTYLGLHCQL